MISLTFGICIHETYFANYCKTLIVIKTKGSNRIYTEFLKNINHGQLFNPSVHPFVFPSKLQTQPRNIP